MSIWNNELNGKRILMLLENCAYPKDDRVRHEAKTLAAAGYQVSVIAPASQGQPWREALDGVDIYRYPNPPSANGLAGYLWEYGYSMAAIFVVSLFVFLSKNFDFIHTHQPPDTFALIAGFYKLFGKRYVFDHHDLAPELYFFARFGGQGNRFLYRILIWFEALSFRLANHVITTNESYKEIAMSRGRVLEKRITVVRNGPDVREMQSSHVEKALRDSGKTIIGYVGVTGVQDGVDNLMRAIRYLVCDMGRSDFLCVIVGSGSAMPALKTLANKLEISSYVLFTGWINSQEEVAKYLNTMDICVAPEPSDPYNRRSTAAKVMEYMAFGKPIVSFDLPEHRFTAQQAAVYARPDDEMDFAQKIAMLMDNPEQCKILSKAGYDRIETELAWPHQARKLVEAYNDITLRF